MKRRLLCLVVTALLPISLMAGKVSFGKGTLNVRQVARNAVRIQYSESAASEQKVELPDWLYVKNDEVKSRDISVEVDDAH